MSNAVPTVFVVDDDPAVLNSLARLLRSVSFDSSDFRFTQEFLERHDPAHQDCVGST